MTWVPIARRKRHLTKRDNKDWQPIDGAFISLQEARDDTRVTRALRYGTDYVYVVVWRR